MSARKKEFQPKSKNYYNLRLVVFLGSQGERLHCERTRCNPGERQRRDENLLRQRPKAGTGARHGTNPQSNVHHFPGRGGLQNGQGPETQNRKEE